MLITSILFIRRKKHEQTFEPVDIINTNEWHMRWGCGSAMHVLHSVFFCADGDQGLVTSHVSGGQNFPWGKTCQCDMYICIYVIVMYLHYILSTLPIYIYILTQRRIYIYTCTYIYIFIHNGFILWYMYTRFVYIYIHIYTSCVIYEYMYVCM